MVTVKNKETEKAVSGVKVTFKVYTGSKAKTKTVTTNSKGQASYASKTLSAGNHKVKVTTTANKNFKSASKQSSIEILKSKISTSIKSTNRINFQAKYTSGILLGYTVSLDVVDAYGNILDKDIYVSSSINGDLGKIRSHVSSFVPAGNGEKLTFTFNGDSIYRGSKYTH